VNLLIVCTANICRSPMAEAAARTFIAERGLAIEVSSAGVQAVPGQPAVDLSIATAAEFGFGDLSAHRSRPASPRLIQQSDVILTMEAEQRQALLARAPQSSGRIWLLGHWVGTEIRDPVGGEAEDFQDCLELMSECLEGWMDRLARMGPLR
jgi:protein-tyrosine phosphatase